MKLVPNVLTPMLAPDVLKAFNNAYAQSVGEFPSQDTLAILVAQSCLECARWKSMHCYNFGNIRPAKDWSYDYCQFRCNEQISPGVWKWYDPPDPGSNFLAFADAESGALFYMNKLKDRWPEAWTGALNGNATLFVHGLKQRGYFTANEAPYLTAVLKLASEFKGDIEYEELDWDSIRTVVYGGIQPDFSGVVE